MIKYAHKGTKERKWRKKKSLENKKEIKMWKAKKGMEKKSRVKKGNRQLSDERKFIEAM